MIRISKLTLTTVAVLIISGCSMKTDQRAECASALETAWQHIDIAKAKGFAGTVSYSKAMGLLTAAKTQQAVESFDSCVANVQRAEFYIDESMKGQ